MKRRSTIIVTVALGAAALGLYELKYEVAALEAAAARLAGDLAKERQAIHVLSTDWTFLNRPENLEVLVEKHLDLVPLDADRIVAAQDLPRRAMPASELAQAEPNAGSTSDRAR